MAVAYLDRQIVSRGAGQSVVAKSAYNSCSSLSAEDGQKDYSHKQGLVHSAILMHDNTEAPARGEFWRAIESREKRKDAQLGYSYAIALPAELSRAQQIDLAENYARWIMDRYGLEAVDVCVHHPVKRRRDADATVENPHIHLLTPTRDREGKKIRLFQDKNDLKAVRKGWEQIANQHLADAGVDARISMDANKQQIAALAAEVEKLKATEAEIKRELDQMEREETMTDAQIQYLAFLARERADERTRATLDAMRKAANIDFYRRNEDILRALDESKYTDADAYARLMYNATRYHLRRIAADEARRRRDDDETRRNRRQYAAFYAHAKQHAATGQDPRRIATIMMYRAGAAASDIAARMVAGMMDENPAMMSASEYIADQIGEQIGAALDALTTEMLRERGRWERRDREIAKIEDAYADMSIHAPQEYREGMEARKQEAIAAARALAAWQERQERAAQREAQKKEEKQQDQPPTPTAADARIFARHAAQAEKTAPSKEKTNEMIALRLRACGHSADDAMRIMCAGMQPDAAMAAVASMFHSPHGDEMMRIARDRAAQWRREEQGQANIRRSTGAAQAQKPAAAAAPKPRM